MADDSIAVVDLDRCSPDHCSYEYPNFYPPNRMGKECITLRGEDAEQGGPDQVHISEEICLGETCGICVEKCPSGAIEIINLPSEFDEESTHCYGENAFSLHGLPVPEAGSVTGILGPNDIGKTTAVRVLADEMVPNLGNYDDDPTWEIALDRFRGTELQNYAKQTRDGETSIMCKPRYADQTPKQFSGTACELLEVTDEYGALDSYIDRLDIGPVIDNDIETPSGDELQRIAFTATLACDRDLYFLDEISSYLDISQRVTAARPIRELAEDEDHAILMVEHDLVTLDLLADTLHVAYGEPGAYGIIADLKSVRNGINEYLKGYLSNENMRIRPEVITFREHALWEATKAEPLVEYPGLAKSYGDGEFSLEVESGIIYNGEVLGVIGPNGIGKSMLAQLFTGNLAPDAGDFDFALNTSYKPWYIEINQPMWVDAFLSSIIGQFSSSYWSTGTANPLQFNRIMEHNPTDLSGGERQRVVTAAYLSQDADLCLLDEPSTHLDVEQRAQATSAIRRYAENHDAAVMVTDHGIYMMNLLTDRLMVFDGESSIESHTLKPQEMCDSMNDFLPDLDTTFRYDERTQHLRINKPDSQLDREQKRTGEYYCAE